MRTGKGHQRSWLFKLGKAESEACNHCGHPTQTGEHITFHCPKWAHTTSQHIGDRKTWAEVYEPIWLLTGPEKGDVVDAVEEWFGHIFGFLA